MQADRFRSIRRGGLRILPAKNTKRCVWRTHVDAGDSQGGCGIRH